MMKNGDFENRDGPLKVAILGCDGYGKLIADRLLACPSAFELTAGVSFTPESAACRELREAGVVVVRDLDRVLHDSVLRPEVVINATPIPAHVPTTIACVKSGVDVWLEKPAASGRAQIQRLAAAVAQSGRYVEVCFNSIFQPQIQRLGKMLRAGAFGEFLRVDCVGAFTRGELYFHRADWTGRLRLGDVAVFDGSLNNTFAHLLSMSLYLLSDDHPGFAQASVRRVNMWHLNAIESEDTCAVELEVSGGIPLLLNLTLCAEEEIIPRMRIECDDAVVEVTGYQQVSIYYRDGRLDRWFSTDDLAMATLDQLLANHRSAGAARVCPLEITGRLVGVVEDIFTAALENGRGKIPSWSFAKRREEEGWVIPGTKTLFEIAYENRCLISDVLADEVETSGRDAGGRGSGICHSMKLLLVGFLGISLLGLAKGADHELPSDAGTLSQLHVLTKPPEPLRIGVDGGVNPRVVGLAASGDSGSGLLKLYAFDGECWHQTDAISTTGAPSAAISGKGGAAYLVVSPLKSVDAANSLVIVGGAEKTVKVMDVPQSTRADIQLAIGSAEVFIVGRTSEQRGSEWRLFRRELDEANRLQATWMEIVLPGFPPASDVTIRSAPGGVVLLGVAADDDPLDVDWWQGDGCGDWRRMGRSPPEVFDWPSAAIGEGFVVFMPTETDGESGYQLNTITGVWNPIRDPRAKDGPPSEVTPLDGDRLAFLGHNGLEQWSLPRLRTEYGMADHLVVGAYVLLMLGVGVGFAARGAKSESDYFQGGKQIPAWASGLSLLATGASGISLLAMPGMAFARDWTYLSMTFYVLGATLVVLLVYVPLVRRLDVATANEYLERRFGVVVRVVGGLLFSLNQLLARTAAIMLLPAIGLNLIIGIPMTTSILIMGIATTIYATLGGFKGVIWTDVIQAVVMLLAIILSVIWILGNLSVSWGDGLNLLMAEGKTQTWNPGLSLLSPTAAVLFANAVVTTLGSIGDQNFIQRVQCTSDERQAKRAVLTLMAVAVPMNCILFLLGSLIFLFYRENPALLNPVAKSDGIFLLFAAQNLPAGLKGLIVAAVLAATMSTLSSAINSTANVGVDDFFRRFSRRNPAERTCVLLGKGLTLVFGVVGTALAVWLSQTDMKSVWDLALALTGMVLAPVSGFFLLGVFTRRANQAGLVVGALGSVAILVYLQTSTPISHLMYLPIGVVTCCALGYAASCCATGRQKDLAGLTAFTISPRKFNTTPPTR